MPVEEFVQTDSVAFMEFVVSVFAAGTHEYMSPLSSSEGVRVVIHPPDTEPYPHTEGFDVPPGYSATFGVKVSSDGGLFIFNVQRSRKGNMKGICTDIATE